MTTQQATGFFPDPSIFTRSDAGFGLRAPSSHAVILMRNMPDDVTMQEGVLFRPDAAQLLTWWHDAWQRINRHLPLPVDMRTNPALLGQGHASYFSAKAAECCSDMKTPDDAQAAAWYMGEAHKAALTAEGERNPRMHIVDDAESLRAIAEVGCRGRVSIIVGPHHLVFMGTDGDGYPVFKRVLDTPYAIREEAIRVFEQQVGDKVRYWRLEGFLEAAGRPFATAATALMASYQLAEMAAAGHRKAFVKGASTKSGTWTVDIEGVRTPADAAGRLSSAMWPDSVSGDGVILQAHTPFHLEQRFFIIGGRIVASVCSDRNFCRLDAVENRRLDDRLAVILKPEVETGAYDRGVTSYVTDRVKAAQFARVARNTAMLLADHGLQDYVLDVGETASGILPIEINSLLQAGPYCLDRRRHLRAICSRSVNAEHVKEMFDLHRLMERLRAVDAKVSLPALEEENKRLSIDLDEGCAIDRSVKAIVGPDFLAAFPFQVKVPDRFASASSLSVSGKAYLSVREQSLYLLVASKGLGFNVEAGGRTFGRASKLVDILNSSGTLPEQSTGSIVLFNDGTRRASIVVDQKKDGTSLHCKLECRDEIHASRSITLPGKVGFYDRVSLDADGGVSLFGDKQDAWLDSAVDAMRFRVSFAKKVADKAQSDVDAAAMVLSGWAATWTAVDGDDGGDDT